MEVSHSVTLKPLINLNYLSYSLVQLALILRTNDLYIFMGKTKFFNETYFDNILNITKGYQDKLSDELIMWEYCPSSRVIKEDLLHFWDTSQKNSTKSTNLFGFVEFLIQNVKIIQANKSYHQINEGKYLTNEYLNVISNAYGSPADKILKIIDELTECESNRVKVIDSQKISVTLAGFSVIFLCFLLIFVVLRISDRYLNDLWNLLRIRSFSQVDRMKILFKDKLKKHSNKLLIDEEIFSPTSNTKKFKFRHSNKLLSKLSLLFTISVVFLLMSTLYFYDDVRFALSYRPLILSSVSRRRFLLSSLTFIVIESYADVKNCSLTSSYHDFSDIKNYNASLIPTTIDLKMTGKYVYKPAAHSLMSKALFDEIFYRYPNSSTFLYAGSFRSVAYMIRESLYLVSNNKMINFSDISDFIQKMKQFNDVVHAICGTADIDSKNIIERKLSYMLIFVTCCSCMLIFMFAIFYYPAITLEVVILKKLVKLLQIIPGSY